MRVPGLFAVIICVFLQVQSCFPSCLTMGSVANCASSKLRWVPPLPPHITHLYLEMNHIGEINASSLSGLEDLQELDLGMQQVPLVIQNNAFRGQQRLRRLVLSFNVQLRLEPNSFLGLSGLKNLHLVSCGLKNSILTGNYLAPLSSLETLDLFGNNINRLQPSLFFVNMTNLKDLNVKLNKIDQICESDLVGFKGKHFDVLNLNSVHLRAMSNEGFNWQECGNPFRGMSFHTLDLSYSGFNVDKLERFFKAIEGTKISRLNLPGHIGKGLSFNNLRDPDHSTFIGLKNSSISILDLSKNRIFALQKGVFSPLKEVAIIDVSQNSVNQIHRNAFKGLQGHLLGLNLSHNLLGEIYSHTFASLTKLRVLDLSHNNIGVLGYGSFSGLPKLRGLFLTGNSLRELGFPASLPSLDYLLLDDNKLAFTSVSGLKRFAGNIKHLDVNGNRLTNLGDVYPFLTEMKDLQNLLYGGNTIRWCSPSTRVSAIGLNKLQVLDLHGSSLQSIWSEGRCLNLFDNLEKVHGLNLSFNSLQTLPQGIFKGLTSVLEMDLSFNSLTYLHPDVLPKSLKTLHLSNNFISSPDPTNFQSLRFLDLRMNRFHCDPNLKNFMTWLIQTNVTFLSPVEELRCEFPSSLYKVPLLDYSSQE